MSEENQNTSKDELIGYHKGALATLTKEYQELARLLNIVQQLMQAHANELEKLGVKLGDAQQGQGNQSRPQGFQSGWEKPPLEDELN